MNDKNEYQATMPLLTGTDVAAKRTELKRYFKQTWSLYESLFATITADEAYFLRPESLRHPLIFYFGHTATFYINKLILGKYIDQRVNSHIESICAVGVDEMSWDDLNTQHYDWPTVDQVKHYRNTVSSLITDLIDTMPLELPIKPDSIAWIILMGIEHERIHIETSSVIMRMLPLKYLRQDDSWSACPYVGDAPSNQLLAVESSAFTLGKPVEDETYGWDNEYGNKNVHVDAFKTSQYLVSNQEFMAFVEQDGYRQSEFWTEEGQNWLAFTQATMPRFWQHKNGQYYQRNLLEEIKLPLNWPVEVNYLEAKAFCHWKSAQTGSHIRLPTEPEWASLRNAMPEDLTTWREAPGNVNLEYFASPCPVDKFATAIKTGDVFDVIGNVWQWTESPFDGFSGFKVHPLYDDFSTPTFDGEHNLIKGGSWISTGNEAQKHSRYAFRRHFFQHAGFRYIESEAKDIPIDKVNTFEDNHQVAQQLDFNYADLTSADLTSADLASQAEPDTSNPLGYENYAVSCVKACLNHFDQPENLRVLDLGCSVGRSSFELASHFAHVDAIDFTARLIQHGFQLQEQGESRYTIKTEGELMSFKNININNHAYADIKHKVNFSQGDACNLKPLYQDYDLIFCANMLERQYDPELFLNSIHQRLNAKGYLVLTSCYDWSTDEQMTSQWLGGVKVNGENFTTLDGLKKLLSDRFELIETRDIPYVLRESARKFQFNNSQMSVWRLIG